MLPPNYLYSLPNFPSSAANFSGPVIISNQRLQNINCILDPTQTLAGLYLGDTLSVKNVDHLIRNNIQSVLSCAAQAMFVPSSNPKVSVVSTKLISASDLLTYDLTQHFEEAYQFIDENLRAKRNVLVNCHAGVSRSAAIVISYIMKKLGLNFEAAFEIVKSRRPRIRPNQRFRNDLKEYEKRITLNYLNGGLTDRDKNLLGKPQIKALDCPTSAINPYPYTQNIRFNRQRTPEFGVERSKAKTERLIPVEQSVGSHKPSGLSITQLLTKTDLDWKNQKELEYKLNHMANQLKKQTSLLGTPVGGRQARDYTPEKKTTKNINSYGTAPSSKDPIRYLDSYPSRNPYDRYPTLNPERSPNFQSSTKEKEKPEKQLSNNRSIPKAQREPSGLDKYVERTETGNNYKRKYY